MSKKIINKNKNLSSALRENLKLRKTQINKRDEKKIIGKRLSKVGYSSLLHEDVNNERHAVWVRPRWRATEKIHIYIIMMKSHNFQLLVY